MELPICPSPLHGVMLGDKPGLRETEFFNAIVSMKTTTEHFLTLPTPSLHLRKVTGKMYNLR